VHSVKKLSALELSGESPCNRQGMSCQGRNLSQNTLRFVEDADLAQYGRPVVINLFSGQTIVRVEGVHAAQRNLDAAACRRKTTPSAEVRSAN
jgi:hypothetical protein